MAAGLSTEDHLCLLLARGRFSPDVAKRVEERLEAGVDWDTLLQRARIHGLVPLVYQRLRALEFRGVPERVHRQLTDTFGANAIRNELLTRELTSVLARLEAAGVPVIPLKGVALAESIYGDPALRVCADLDVLIHPKHLPQSLGLLRSCSYQDRFGEPGFVRLLARYGKDGTLMREEGRLVYPLQLHCGLIWGGPAERALLAEMWSEARSATFHAAPAHFLSSTWEFLYLAVHAARHGLFPCKWLVDLDWFLISRTLDWKDVESKAGRLGWTRVVQSCLAACSELLETPVPEPFADRLASRRPRASIAAPGPLEILKETFFAARLLPGLTRRLRFLAARLFVPTPADGEFLHLPTTLFFLYYLVRPLRLSVTVAGWCVQAGASRLRRLLRRH